jgi:hypothetical protein
MVTKKDFEIIQKLTGNRNLQLELRKMIELKKRGKPEWIESLMKNPEVVDRKAPIKI